MIWGTTTNVVTGTNVAWSVLLNQMWSEKAPCCGTFPFRGVLLLPCFCWSEGLSSWTAMENENGGIERIIFFYKNMLMASISIYFNNKYHMRTPSFAFPSFYKTQNLLHSL